ncbi:MAG: lysylphosphatidylglycerol synthase transmembrane domain-containing protein [Thermomicrobiales bacterium]
MPPPLPIPSPGPTTEGALQQSRWIRLRAQARPVIVFLRRYGVMLWLALIVVAGIYIVTQQRDELAETWDLICTANPRWIAGILGLEVFSFVAMAAVYGLALAQLGHRVGLPLLIVLHLQRSVVSGLTPMGGPTSVVVFVVRLRQRGIPPQDSLLATFVKSALGHLAFLCILIPALFVRRPTAILVLGMTGLLALVIAMFTVIAWVIRGHRLPKWMFRFTPRRLLRVLVSLRQHSLSPMRLIWPLAILILFRLSGVLTLWASLRAVGWNGGLVEPIAAYAVGAILYGAAPILQGFGIVEIGTAIALQRVGVPTTMAVSATLISRILGQWLPLTIGIVEQFIEALWRRWRTNPESPTSSRA